MSWHGLRLRDTHGDLYIYEGSQEQLIGTGLASPAMFERVAAEGRYVDEHARVTMALSAIFGIFFLATPKSPDKFDAPRGRGADNAPFDVMARVLEIRDRGLDGDRR